MKYDFCGWATKNDLRCGDRRIIRKNAFKDDDGKTVPLVWNHRHDSPEFILGHALLKNTSDGVYTYCTFNDGPKAKEAKIALKNGDITNLSILANQLTQDGDNVVHGSIREVSLVLAGANPGAFIESVLAHGEPIEDYDTEGYIYTNEPLVLRHADEEDNGETEKKPVKDKRPEKPAKTEKTIKEVVDTYNDEQKMALAYIVSQVAGDSESKKEEEKKGEEEMGLRHNLFEQPAGKKKEENHVLSHSDFKVILADAHKMGSLKESVMHHLEEGGVLYHAEIPTTGMTVATGKQNYGINDVDMLLPDYHNLTNVPEFISRDMDWVSKVMGGIRAVPFSRIKSLYANITEDEARAKGYIKGNQKKTEVFTTLKRTTDPTTVYKFQKMDRDDIIDITDFDVVAWLKTEMRMMLHEEIARAILMGDGRQSDAEDKIDPVHIRPIATDVPLFNTTTTVSLSGVTDKSERGMKLVDTFIEARINYKGSGNPTLFTTETVLSTMLLQRDKMGHRMYKNIQELATDLRVKEIVPVEPMETTKIDGKPLVAIIVNLADYVKGADKGGQENMFDDFDLNFNKMEYLIETRMSGALTKPFSALTFLSNETSGGAQAASLRNSASANL